MAGWEISLRPGLPNNVPPMTPLRRLGLGLLLAGAVLYGVALLAVSLTSKTVVLPKGQPLRFCGAYLDCHLSATVTGLEIQPGPGGGLRYRVIVRFASDAKRARLPIRNLKAVLLVPGGRLEPVATPRYLELAAGESLGVDFVFNTLNPINDPVLWLSEGGTLARVSEKLLIGDPDSFLHKPVLLAVTDAGKPIGLNRTKD
jgi:hypothetical protein